MTTNPGNAADPTQQLIDEVREHGKPVSRYFAGQQVLLLSTTGAKHPGRNRVGLSP